MNRSVFSKRLTRSARAQEFDYKREASFLEAMNEEVAPHFSYVSFPKPVKKLCTKRCLVMSHLDGKSVSKIGAEILKLGADRKGVSVEAFKRDMRQKMMQDGSSQKLLKGSWGLSSWKVKLVNWWTGAELPDGRSVMKMLYEVHGYQIFECGKFNADPHAGNVLVDKVNNVGLVDYGQVSNYCTLRASSHPISPTQSSRSL